MIRLLLIILAIVLVFAVTPVQAQGVVVSINAPADVVVGDEFDVAIDITGVTNFDAGQFDISIDKSLVELTGIGNGQINSTEIPVSLWNEISSGVYRIVVNAPGVWGVSGSGCLVVLKFKALANGESLFTISNGFLNDNKAIEIKADWEGASAYLLCEDSPILEMEEAELFTLLELILGATMALIVGLLIGVFIKR